MRLFNFFFGFITALQLLLIALYFEGSLLPWLLSDGAYMIYWGTSLGTIIRYGVTGLWVLLVIIKVFIAGRRSVQKSNKVDQILSDLDKKYTEEYTKIKNNDIDSMITKLPAPKYP